MLQLQTLEDLAIKFLIYFFRSLQMDIGEYPGVLTGLKDVQSINTIQHAITLLPKFLGKYVIGCLLAIMTIRTKNVLTILFGVIV